MKPVSYQSVPSSVNGGHPALSLDPVLTTSNVRYCEKCGFAATDAAVFEKHMLEHVGTPFYCFYCSHVFFSETELNAHLKRHTSKYPFKCPHCGQGYMRRLCLVKHIERLHSKSIIQGPAKPGGPKNPQVPVPGALTSLHAADPSSMRPLVRVTVPAPSVPAVRLGKDEQRGKTLETNVSNGTNGNTERLSPPLNGLIQHNRALTVSLPDEVTIPAGCLVELVEVKTVNGTKELKLRLVAQQENESVIKDGRTTVSQNTALGKPLSSTLINHTNTVRSMNMGMSAVNRKQCETKMVNVERPVVVPVSVSSNLIVSPVSKEKSGLKRSSPEIINLESNTVIPNKVPKSIISPVREGGNSGIRVTQTTTVSHNAAPLPVISNRVTSRLNTTTLHPNSLVSQRVVDERKNLIPEYAKSIPPRRASDPKNIQDLSVAMKLEPREIHLKSSTTSKPVKEATALNQDRMKSTSPSLRGPVVASAQVRPPMGLVSKDVSNKSFSLASTLNKPVSVKTPILSNHADSKTSTWTQGVRLNEMARERNVSQPESFPIISSVFSLSQQPEDAQGPIQPLVMALRGIVMDKSSSSVTATQNDVKITSTDHVNKAPTVGHSAQVATKNGSFTQDLLLTEQTHETVKAEDHHKGVHQSPTLTHNHIHVKEEKKSISPTDNKCSDIPASESLAHEESKVPKDVKASETGEPPQQTTTSEQDVSSKFLTVTLKRVQVGVWKKTKKGLKLRISKYKTQVPVSSVTDCTVIYPMPLKVDQLVKRPGPNQPVVVLNHPKPRISAQGTRAEPCADTGAPEVVPKCQILKMRLSKVMGQKYEVMGCTVRVFP